MGAKSTAFIVAVAALRGVSACGTRLPNAAFVTSGGRVVNGSTSGDGVGAAVAATPGERASAAPSGLPGALPGVAAPPGAGAAVTTPSGLPVPGLTSSPTTRPATSSTTAKAKAGTKGSSAKPTGRAQAGSSAATAANAASGCGVTAARIEIGNIVSSGNNVFDYAGATYLQSSDVPDIGGEPVSNVYDADSHLYSISGDSNPRSGNPGYADGKAWSGSQVGTFFNKSVGVTHLGVVYYNESDSQRGASEIAGEFSNADVTTTAYAVNLGLPNSAAAVSQMQADGVDAVADELDENGNQKLCQAIQQNPTFLSQMKAKISTEASWTSHFQKDFASTPNCRAKSYATGLVANYDDTPNPGVAAFHSAFTTYFGSKSPYLAEWALHGWVSAMWLTDAMTSCGANLTRSCVEAYMNRNTKYDAGGLLDPSSFVSPPESAYTAPGASSTDCVTATQWSDANGGHWATRATVAGNCYTTPWYSYSESG